MTHQRIGFACKWIDHPDQVTKGVKDKDPAKEFNTKATTVAWLNRQTRSVAEDKLWEIVKYNIESTRKLVERVGTLDSSLRMVRLSSDILPVYTEPTWGYFMQQPDVRSYCEREFRRVGASAKMADVRLSFHPGQFCVLASDSEDVVRRSIEEFEYHVDMARWMGYGSDWHDSGFKINVHVAGRNGPDGIRAALNRMSVEARNLITIENEENKYGLDDILTLGDCLSLVLDIHHHWCREGSYVSRLDDRIKRIIDSWRGVRPVLHFSSIREDLHSGTANSTLPDFKVLMEDGIKRQHMRAHSAFMWNKEHNRYAYDFWDAFDIMVESKAKNLASTRLHKEFQCYAGS